MKKATVKSKNGKNGYSDRGTGRLYKRGKDGKEYPAGDPHAGIYYLEYRVNGKRTRQRLLDPETDEPITEREEAEKERARIMAPFTTSSKVDQLRDIKAKLEETEREYSQAVEEANPPLRIADAWNEYLNSHDAPETGVDTLKYYEGYWKKFREWIGDKHPAVRYLRDITPISAKSYASFLRHEKLTPNTFNKHIGFLRLFFNALATPARTKENPFGAIKKRKLHTSVRRELTTTELKDILDKADGELKTLLMLGTFTGLRLGDCCTLKWGEVDLDRRQVKRVPNKLRHKDRAKPVIVGIHPALFQELANTPIKKRKGYILPRFAELYTYRSASGRPTRQPEISKQIQAHFMDTCDIQIHKEGTGYIKVPDPTGKHEYVWKHTGKRAVVEVGFHSLRHTFVSLQAEAGTPLAVVQAIVGHGNPAMTAHYTHIGEKAMQQAALAMPSDIVDAEFEVLLDPLPAWAKELAEKLNSKNWKTIKAGLLANA